MSTTILRLPQVLAITGKKRTSLYSDIKAGLFSRPVKIGPRAAGWPVTDADSVNAARIAGKTDGEIRALVRKLEANRMTAV